MESTNATAALPWWRIPALWLVIGGPALVVLASVATLVLALRGADPVVRAPAQDRIDAATPATQARNHASRIPR